MAYCFILRIAQAYCVDITQLPISQDLASCVHFNFLKMFCSRVTAKRIVRLISIVSFVVPALIVYNTQFKRKNITSEHIKPVKKSSLGNKELLLFVGIHSAPSRIDRRNAIRETWMKECQWNPNVVCRFFTDGQDPNGKELDGDKRIKLENESRVYGDILLA